MSHILVVPVHPPKVLHLIQFLHSCNQPQTHTPILLVFTNRAEAEMVNACVHSSACATHLNIQHMIVQEWSQAVLGTQATQYLLHNQNNCVVNYKKFAALRYVSEQNHQFAVIIDADTLCMGHLDKFMQSARANYQKAESWGCAVDAQSVGIGSCTLSIAMLSPAAQHSCQQQSTHNIYNWFLDPPSYHVQDVRDFFQNMIQTHGGLSEFFMKTSWFTYDFLVFSQWLASEHRARIRDYSHMWGENHVPEILTVDQLLHLRYAVGHDACWISTAAWLKSPHQVSELLPRCHMMYHVDRPHV
jgi:hypothetical protein